MIIIGEKINGFIPKTLDAIQNRDEEYIKSLARGQSKAGATYIDVCAGVEPAVEHETMEWLIGLVQSVTDTPLCIDSPDPRVVVDMIPFANTVGCLNSISLEKDKCEIILPVIAGTDWKVVALTCDDTGIPDDPETKYAIAKEIIRRATDAGVPQDNILIDPLVTTLATNQDSMVSFIKTMEMVKAEFPDVHITSGLSNISYGMPYRKAVNMQFLSLCMSKGMDSAIIDPMSSDMLAAMYATNALLGEDPFCKDYLTAFRKGLFGRK